MQKSSLNSVSSHNNQGLSGSLYRLAEAASKRLFSRDSTMREEFVADVLKDNKIIVNLPFGDLIARPQSPTLKCFSSQATVSRVGVVSNKAKNSRLSAHDLSLPKQASPLSPHPRPVSPYRHLASSHTPYSIPYNGYTNSGLRLIKWHWEYRYEHWLNSFNRSDDVSFSDENPVEIDLNPALFPRAGSLSRPQNDPESRALIGHEWALRHWSIDKVSRTLFLHDLSARLTSSDPYFVQSESFLGRPWEWDWKMKWKIIEDAMVREHDRLRQCWDGANDGYCIFDEDVVMSEILGEDRMDVFE